MTTLQMLITIAFFLIAGLTGLILSLQCAQYFMGRPISIKKIFDGLKPKIWMTAGVGFFFFFLYAIVVLLGTNLMNQEIRMQLFNMMHSNPILFVYLGLVLFITISLSILGIRSIIKRIYNSRG